MANFLEAYKQARTGKKPVSESANIGERQGNNPGVSDVAGPKSMTLNESEWQAIITNNITESIIKRLKIQMMRG